MTTVVLTQVRTLVRQLTTQEKLYLLNDITSQLVQETTSNTPSVRSAFPIFHVDEWPSDTPQRREDLYDERGR